MALPAEWTGPDHPLGVRMTIMGHLGLVMGLPDRAAD